MTSLTQISQVRNTEGWAGTARGNLSRYKTASNASWGAQVEAPLKVPLLGLWQVSSDAYPVGEVGCLWLENHVEGGVGLSKVSQVNSIPTCEVGSPDSKGAHSDDSVVALHEQCNVSGGGPLKAIASK